MTNPEFMLRQASRICIAYLRNNHVQASELDRLIREVYSAIAACADANDSIPRHFRHFQQPLRGSLSPQPGAVGPDGIVSCINGRVYKTLKRHLAANGLDPETYRRKFGLRKDYPMVAPGYAAKRAAIATRIGLGRPGFIAELATQDRGGTSTTDLQIDGAPREARPL